MDGFWQWFGDDAGWMLIAAFVFVCWFSREFGRSVRKNEVSALEMAQAEVTSSQYSRIKKLRERLGEKVEA